MILRTVLGLFVIMFIIACLAMIFVHLFRSLRPGETQRSRLKKRVLFMGLFMVGVVLLGLLLEPAKSREFLLCMLPLLSMATIFTWIANLINLSLLERVIKRYQR